MQFLMGGRVLDAKEAVAWGIAAEVVPAAGLAERPQVEGRRLAAGPTVAFGQLRRLLRGAATVTWAEHLQREHAAMVTCGGSDDAREGITAFAERREPQFRGS
jgi:2-(1,2-epoxy-1,2-dihydrophenyl)acetyl-CoA isomerase